MNIARERSATLERWYEEHATALLRLAVLSCGDRPTAEDVVHETFLRCLHAVPGPQPGKERAYLRRTVLNLSSNHHRSARRRAPDRLEPPAVVEAAEARVVASVVAGSVADAVRALPPRQRDCVLLHYFDRLTDVEIGEVLDISPGSVKTHLHRARAALRPTLEPLR